MHYSEQRSNTGLELNLLQKFLFISLTFLRSSSTLKIASITTIASEVSKAVQIDICFVGIRYKREERCWGCSQCDENDVNLRKVDVIFIIELNLFIFLGIIKKIIHSKDIISKSRKSDYNETCNL